MDQPAQHAALGTEPVRTIDRDELKAKLDRVARRENHAVVVAIASRWGVTSAPKARANLEWSTIHGASR